MSIFLSVSAILLALYEVAVKLTYPKEHQRSVKLGKSYEPGRLYDFLESPRGYLIFCAALLLELMVLFALMFSSSIPRYNAVGGVAITLVVLNGLVILLPGTPNVYGYRPPRLAWVWFVCLFSFTCAAMLVIMALIRLKF